MTVSTTPAFTSTGCRLVSTEGRELPLRSVELSTDAGGGLARVRLRQVFVNPHAEPLHVSYLLPLPADGAVVDLAFVVGGRRVVGRVERKAAAREAFERAVLEGRTATLLEQDRADLFTQELGNVPPGATVEVELDVEQPLRWEDGGWTWRFPTVVGPRFLGDAALVPDAERVTLDVAERVPARCSAFVQLGDTLTGPATSPSHVLTRSETGVALEGALDRDVVVRWPVAAPEPGLRMELARPAGDPDAYGLLTLVPPAIAAVPVARDLCLLIDTSGSMSGAPLAQAVAFCVGLVGGLRTGDRLEMIEFSSAPHRWKPAPVPVDAASRAAAVAWLTALRASGGTAMHEAVTEALAPLRADAERQVVLVTDGYIGFEREVVGRVRRGLPRGSRLHVVGIGSSVNRTLTAGASRAGGGHEAVVAPDEPVAGAVAALLARTGDPLWVDVSLSGTALREQAPATIPDLLAGAPARVALRLAPGGGSLVVSTRTAAGVVQHRLEVAPSAEGSGRRVLATRFAREAVEDLELALACGDDPRSVDAAIEALGLRHRLATRLTSWVAVDEAPSVDPSAPTRAERVPHLLPHGVSAEGVGLRAAAVASPMALGGAVASMAPGAPTPAPAGAPLRRARAESKKEAPPPPPPPSVTPVVVEGWADRLSDRSSEREEERSEAAPAPAPKSTAELAPKRTVKARRTVLADGRVVLEFEVTAPLDWAPDRVVVVTADGHRLPVTPVVGTTRAGRIEAGVRVRLVLDGRGPISDRIEVGDLVVELG